MNVHTNLDLTFKNSYRPVSGQSFPYYLFYMENICFIFTFILQQKGDLWS